ncbi:MAG: hypothetical protein N2B02_00945, partial [Amylibacter sp.]
QNICPLSASSGWYCLHLMPKPCPKSEIISELGTCFDFNQIMSEWEGKDITFNMNGTVIAAGDHARLEELIDLLQTG